MHADVVAQFTETLRQVQTVRDQRNLDLVAAMCKCAEGGDVAGMKRIVAGGHHPDEGDYDARRPLHVAASKGVAAAVKYLVDAGAGAPGGLRYGMRP